MSAPLQDTQDPAVAFFLRNARPIKEPDFEIEGFIPPSYGNEAFEEFFNATAQYPVDALDIRNVVARLM